MKKIILISGKAESGKNYVAELITAGLIHRGYTVQSIAFGDYLKFICQKYLGWNGKKDKCGRTYLQYVGTDVCRGYDDMIFSSKVVEIIKLFGSKWDFVIIPDLRFISELHDIESSFADVTTVRINRPGYESNLTEEQKSNRSETEFDNFDFDKVIINDITLTDQVKNFVEEMVNGLYEEDCQ